MKSLSNALSSVGATSDLIAAHSGGWTVIKHLQIHKLPIGRIAEPSTNEGSVSADNAREIVNDVLSDFGPLIHLALAPHPKHNHIEVLEEAPRENIVVVGDGVIVPVTKAQPSFTFATMVGDCHTIVVLANSKVAFLHAGSPEIFDGLLDEFPRIWGDEEIEWVSIGPGIGVKNYELPPDKVPDDLHQYMVAITDESYGFDCFTPIFNAFRKMGVSERKLDYSKVDPYERLSHGKTAWASNRWYRQKGEYSPRDLATAIVLPGSNWESPGHDLL